MTGENKPNNFTFYFLLFIIALFILGRFLGGTLFDNHWSFNHWSFQPTWYAILWFVLLAAISFLFLKYSEKIERFFENRRTITIGLLALFILTVILHFDSFLYGGGNVRIAQIGQAGKILYPWYEFGTIATVSLLFHFFNLFPFDSIPTAQANIAAVMAWRMLAYIATALSILGAVKLVKEIAPKTADRFYLFLILFFGGQSLLYFGYIGPEPVIVAASVWFGWAAVKLSRDFTFGKLLLLWLITALAVVVHITSLYMLPALLYLTFSTPFKKGIKIYLPVTIALISLFFLVFIVYDKMGDSLRFSQYLLFLKGHLPYSDYGLFSGRHLGDILQLLFLAVPLAAVMKVTAFLQKGWLRNNPPAMAFWLMGFAGVILVFIANPTNSIVLDFPRFTAYLTAYSFLFVLLLVKMHYKAALSRRFTAVLAAAALMLPFSYLPSYIKLEQAKHYLNDYMERHENFYRMGLIAIRDAHFYRKEFRSADYWEWQLPVKSLEYLNLKGTRDLIHAGRNDEALKVLYQAVSRNPYWTEPREMIAIVQMNLGRLELAKPQIDTCLMLEPNKKEYLSNLYRYFRDSGNLVRAKETVDRMLSFFPDDPEVKTDLMIISYRLGRMKTADSLADQLMEYDPNLPFPYLIKGFIREKSDDLKATVRFYQKFIELGPMEVEKPMIEQKLDSLQAVIKEKQL
ncbi:MAG: hypothetical protein JXA92_11685 [candidate division Zixibacteria bacterium]|nr:hypothetical protein [candidate division Zixibacteria bacterium]